MAFYFVQFFFSLFVLSNVSALSQLSSLRVSVFEDYDNLVKPDEQVWKTYKKNSLLDNSALKLGYNKFHLFSIAVILLQTLPCHEMVSRDVVI